jgi:hypothetical protein
MGEPLFSKPGAWFLYDEDNRKVGRPNGRPVFQFKSDYNEKIGGGRWNRGDRLASFATMTVVRDFSNHRRSTANGRREVERTRSHAVTNLRMSAA